MVTKSEIKGAKSSLMAMFTQATSVTRLYSLTVKVASHRAASSKRGSGVMVSSCSLLVRSSYRVRARKI